MRAGIQSWCSEQVFRVPALAGSCSREENYPAKAGTLNARVI